MPNSILNTAEERKSKFEFKTRKTIQTKAQRAKNTVKKCKEGFIKL